MNITMRLSRILAASALAASAGLAVGLTAAPAGAEPPQGPGELCLSPPCETERPDDLANPTENPDPEVPDEPGEPTDVPIPTDANFTG
jgi:hypothetical protein